MAACIFCRLDPAQEPAVELSIEGSPRGVACGDVTACRLRVALGGLHEWTREDRDALRRISDVLSVLPERERHEALSDMTRRLIDD